MLAFWAINKFNFWSRYDALLKLTVMISFIMLDQILPGNLESTLIFGQVMVHNLVIQQVKSQLHGCTAREKR